MKPFAYRTSVTFLEGFDAEDKLKLYGAFGGTALYLQLRQEVQEPGIYSAIIEAIAGGASKSNEIATKDRRRIGEMSEVYQSFV